MGALADCILQVSCSDAELEGAETPTLSIAILEHVGRCSDYEEMIAP